MPPISEPPRPPIPPEQRPARLLTIDTTDYQPEQALYVNAAYKWLHQVAKRESELDAEVTQVDCFRLILLQAPMVVTCIQTAWTFRMMAAILRIDPDGIVNGWMISEHQEARDTFDMLTNPERSMEEPDDEDDQDLQPDDEDL